MTASDTPNPDSPAMENGNPYTVLCHESDREKWLALRAEGVGGSESPCLLGLRGWASGLSLQLKKWGLDPDDDAGEFARWGSRLEPVVIAGAARDIPIPGLESFGCLLRSNHWPWMQVTPDAILLSVLSERGRFYQIKCAGMGAASAWDDGPPHDVWIQQQHELAVTGHDSCGAIALLHGNTLVSAEIERDEDAIGEIVELAQRFHKATEEHEPWPSDGSDASTRALKLLYPHADPEKTITLDPVFAGVFDELEQIASEEGALRKAKAALSNRVKEALADASSGLLPDGRSFTYHDQKRAATAASEFRVLRRKKRSA